MRVLDRSSRSGKGNPRVLSDRLIFVDNLRTVLTVTVLLHHLAVTYGWSQGWYVHEPVGPGIREDVLSAFILLTQAFFMGAFFLISAYFIPGSYERRGERSFVIERLRRLLIPLLVFRFVISPLTSMVVLWVQYGQRPALADYPGLINAGPLWFVELLLVLSAGWVIWRRFRPEILPAIPWKSRPPSGRALIGFIGVLGLVTWLWRFEWPIYSYLHKVDFPTPAFLPQYVLMFLVGVVAYRRDWLVTVPSRLGVRAATAALAATVTLLPLSMAGDGDRWRGGVAWESLAFAIWESIFAVGVILGLFTWFRARYDHQGATWQRWTGESYAVYVIHAPIIVGLTLVLMQTPLPPLGQLVVATVVGVPGCYLTARSLRRIPTVDRIL
ncbi:MAG TPA: acyltransferase [Thermomicrobiales bacterium]|nr:acyltransferase [Thermomicrobiales bacterium]